MCTNQLDVAGKCSSSSAQSSISKLNLLRFVFIRRLDCSKPMWRSEAKQAALRMRQERATYGEVPQLRVAMTAAREAARCRRVSTAPALGWAQKAFRSRRAAEHMRRCSVFRR